MNSSNSARLQRCENQLRRFLDEAVRGVIAVGITAGIYLIREFSPELKKTFHRRF